MRVCDKMKKVRLDLPQGLTEITYFCNFNDGHDGRCGFDVQP